MGILFFFLLLAPLTRADEKPIKLLFAGSSSTYFNDLPREVAKVLDGKFAGHIGAKVMPEIIGRSGSDIRVYLEPGFNRYEYGVKPGQTFLDRIRDGKPSFVVLQTICSFIMVENDPTGTGKAHVGDTGHFLNLACFYAEFQPDAYQAKMPKWMFKNISMALSATLEDETAKYLEGVALEMTKGVKAKLDK